MPRTGGRPAAPVRAVALVLAGVIAMPGGPATGSAPVPMEGGDACGAHGLPEAHDGHGGVSVDAPAAESDGAPSCPHCGVEACAVASPCGFSYVPSLSERPAPLTAGSALSGLAASPWTAGAGAAPPTPPPR